jgi:hypothetical protein
MPNIFIYNPIKLNIISSNNTIKKTIIFVGQIPKNVESELLKVKKMHDDGKKNLKNKTLEKFYGKKWTSKFGITDTKVSGGSPQNEVSQKDDNIFSFDDSPNSSNLDKLGDLDDVDKSEQSILTNKISLDEIENMDDLEPVDYLEDLNLEDVDLSNLYNTETVKNKNLDISKDKIIKLEYIFSDPYMSVYPEDNILEFKGKIAAVTGIPIYRQHLWHTYQGRVYPMAYSASYRGVLLYINVVNMLNRYNVLSSPEYDLNADTESDLNLFEGIPISTQYDKMKNLIKIECNDTFNIMQNYFYNFECTEFNLLDLNEFINNTNFPIIKKSINKNNHQLQLIYYGFILIYWPIITMPVLMQYFDNVNNISKIFPDISQTTSQIYKRERLIIDEKYNSMLSNNIKSIKSKIKYSVLHSIQQVYSFIDSSAILSLRNLFDIISLNSIVTNIRCVLLQDGKKIILDKNYKNCISIKEKNILNIIIFRIKLNEETEQYIDLILYKNGNYLVKAKWRIENNYSFDDIIYIVSNSIRHIINLINASHAIAYKKKIPYMLKKNTKFTEISIGLVYKSLDNFDNFDILSNITDTLDNANIISTKEKTQNTIDFYFLKGMHNFKSSRIDHSIETSNSYEFLTDGIIKQKWYTLFQKTRRVKIEKRLSDIRIEMTGVNDVEFDIFYDYVLYILYLYHQNSAKVSNTPVYTQNTKKSQSLKDQDPLLYDFKKLYNSDEVYSRICQKPYQPLILTKKNYEMLNNTDKKNAVQYWNFTNNESVYYSCPNKKYPYIKFFPDKHPKNYCIPCCKKNKISDNKNDVKRMIYDACIKDHIYTKSVRTITKGSHYIMSYGKDVEPGRLSKLPDDSLESLFYETFSMNTPGTDQECASNDGYFLYGVDQNILQHSNMGFLNILINAMEMPLIELIENIIKKLNSDLLKFSILLNGNIRKYFTTAKHLADTLYELFISTNILYKNDIYAVIPWNEIFMDISFNYYNTQIILFNHAKKHNIQMILKNKTSDVSFLNDDIKYIIVMKKNKYYFPIYLLNVEIFFKLKLITKKMFIASDNIMQILFKLIKKFNSADQSNVSITLDIYNKFFNSTLYPNEYVLKHMFINQSNLCYYIYIEHKTDKLKNVYIPISESYYTSQKNIKLIYNPFIRKTHKTSIKALTLFISYFNEWLNKESKANSEFTHYPRIEIDQWFLLAPVNHQISNLSKVIGFIFKNVNYYFSPHLSLKEAIKYKNVKSIRSYYDPDIVNEVININKPMQVDNRIKNIGISTYENNLYQLLLLEFMAVFNLQKNVSLRGKIKKVLLKNFNNEFTEIMLSLNNIIDDCDDYNIIKLYIVDFIEINHNKNELFSIIDNTSFNFDKISFENLKSMSHDKIVKELHKISKQFILIGSIKNIKKFTFHNMFVSCQSTNDKSKNMITKMDYCKKNKLIIEQKKLNELIDILASDILNPIKQRWIFSSLIFDNTINFFKFIRRPDENIIISIE